MLRAQGWGLREETLGAPAVVQAKDERGVDQAVEGRRGRKALGGFDDKTVRICYALDLGREKQDTRPLPSLLSRASGLGAGEARHQAAPKPAVQSRGQGGRSTVAEGLFCFPGTRAAPGSSSVGSADASRINEGMDPAKRGGDLPRSARPALRVPRPSVFAEVLTLVSGQSPAFR